jgi:hypothetical protein
VNPEGFMGRGLVVELHRSPASKASRWQIVVSIPGSESTFAQTWGSAHRRLNHSELTDLAAWVEDFVVTAIFAAEGSQEELL